MFWGLGPDGVLRGGPSGPRGDLELPRGMSATTLPGGKYLYGICQIVKNGGVRGCLLVEVWVVWDLSEFDVLLPDRGRYWVTLRAEVKVASPATPMIYIFCPIITQVAGKA